MTCPEDEPELVIEGDASAGPADHSRNLTASSHRRVAAAHRAPLFAGEKLQNNGMTPKHGKKPTTQTQDTNLELPLYRGGTLTPLDAGYRRRREGEGPGRSELEERGRDRESRGGGEKNDAIYIRNTQNKIGERDHALRSRMLV
jgi:hypothetical protein